MLKALKRSALGARAPHFKNTADSPTVEMPVPSRIVLPMGQHVGAPAIPTVAKGDRVFVGTVVGRPDGHISAAIHSGVSGVVESIAAYTAPNGAVQTEVVILPDGKQTVDPSVKPPVVTDLESLREAVRASGLVGLGGAGFPTAEKLSGKHVGQIDVLVVNGAECEPYVTSDNRCMEEETEHIVHGIRLLMKYLQIPRCVIGIESIQKANIKKLTAATAGMPVEIKKLPCTYPQGAEKILIETCTGREVPLHGLPSDVGVLVMNVTSVAFIAAYLETGMPLVKKRLTVDGDAVKHTCNVSVIVGTPIREVIDFCGGLAEQPGKVLYGGPMMGICVEDLDQPVLKNNNAILVLSEKRSRLPQPTACIHCGRCTNACPLGLSAKEIVQAYEEKDVALLRALHADLCMNCGTCSFVCPAKRPLAPSVALAKILLRTGGEK